MDLPPKVNTSWLHLLANLLLGKSDYMPNPTPQDYAALLAFNQEQGVKPQSAEEVKKALAAAKNPSDTERIIAGMQIKKYQGRYPPSR